MSFELAVINLEGGRLEPHEGPERNDKSAFLYSSAAAAHTLQDWNVRVATLANNHIWTAARRLL